MTFSKKPLVRAMIVAGAALAPQFAFSAVIEEVVVTAQKRTQSVNDIDVSASAYGSEQLDKLGLDDPTDLGAFTPGLITVNATSGGTPIFAIRGIGLDDFSPNNTSGVGVYTDEVFASNPAFLGGQLFDIDRVEVLKGPQGTLYGKNTTGGAINFISKKPTEEFEGYAELGYGRFNTLEATGAISGALSDGVQGRLSANYIDADGWQNDAVTGRELGSQERFALRGQLSFDIGDNGSALVKAHYSQDQSIPPSPDVEGLGDAFGDPSFDALNSPSAPGLVTTSSLDVNRDESGQGISLKIDYAFEHFDFTSISAVDSYDREVVDNYGGFAAAILDFYQDNQIDQQSQEFRFISNSDSSFSWVAGLNVSNEEVDVLDTFDDSYFVTDSVAVTGVFDPADVSAQGLDLLTADYVQETDSYGLYVHTETDLNDYLKLIVGARYSKDERSFNGISTNTDAAGSFNDTIVELNETQSDSFFTGKLGLDWLATDDVLVYGSISTSYKSGAYYGAAVLDSDAWSYLQPEEVTAYELGFKSTLLDSSLQLNGAVFMLDYEDRQSLITFLADDFSNFLGFPVFDTTLVNIPEAETRGFEVDVTWHPSDNLKLLLGVGYLDAEITQSPTTAGLRGININPSVNDQATIDGAGFVDALAAPLATGEALSQSPEWSYNGSVSYDIQMTDGLLLELQTNYSWVDTQVAQLSDINAEYGPISSWDANATLTSEESNVSISLWIKNLQDKEAETYSFSSFAGRGLYRQQPTSYGITLRYAL